MSTPWECDWPADGLEVVGCCPVCASIEREVLHLNLVDNVFRAAPGKWRLWRCLICNSAYVDPRPNLVKLPLAYADYYTHRADVGESDYKDLALFRKIFHRLANGYRNWRFGTNEQPASNIGVLLAFAAPWFKHSIDWELRNLHKLTKSGGALLDVGCGSGLFLSRAKRLGWDVVGVEPDPNAALLASARKLEVHVGGIEYFDGQCELFDVITLNHVIEHVHAPIEILKRCFALLKPSGYLWIETPNISSFGHSLFRENWRGIEAPRHLVLFNYKSLGLALRQVGFENSSCIHRPSPSYEMFKSSSVLKSERSLDRQYWDKLKLYICAILATTACALFKGRREFLTVVANKSV